MPDLSEQFHQQVIHGEAPVSRQPAVSNDPRVHKRFKIITLTTIILNLCSLAVLLTLSLMAKAGASGTEFFVLPLLPAIFLGYGLALFYIIYFPYYLLKYKQKNMYVTVGAIFFIISIVLVALLTYSTKRQQAERTQANTILTIPEAAELIDTCNVKSVDEGTRRFQATVGDVTYIRLKEPIKGQGSSLERYARYGDFDAIKNHAQQLSAKCGKIETYTREETRLDKNKSFEYAQ